MMPEHPFTSAGLTVEATFIPFSQSRNKASKLLSLNWRVTLLHNGKPILTTDYMMGIGHAPASKLSVREVGHRNSLIRHKLLEREAETGRAAYDAIRPSGAPILPAPLGVIADLLNECDVLDYGAFEQWAPEFGYDPDSRSAEKIYRQCLEHALTLRAALGDQRLAALREIARDL